MLSKPHGNERKHNHEQITESEKLTQKKIKRSNQKKMHEHNNKIDEKKKLEHDRCKKNIHGSCD